LYFSSLNSLCCLSCPSCERLLRFSPLSECATNTHHRSERTIKKPSDWRWNGYNSPPAPSLLLFFLVNFLLFFLDYLWDFFSQKIFSSLQKGTMAQTRTTSRSSQAEPRRMVKSPSSLSSASQTDPPEALVQEPITPTLALATTTDASAAPVLPSVNVPQTADTSAAGSTLPIVIPTYSY